MRWKGGNQDVVVVGLGIGGMAAHARRGQHFVFFEIDPDVIKIAENPEYFTCLKKCRGTYEVILGDGRLALARLDRKFGLIMLDAFNSDSVPVHLLSTEAVGSYLTKLADDGILLFNISNRYLDFRPLMGALAGETGLVCYCRVDKDVSADQASEGKLPSIFVVMARRPEDLGRLPGKNGWHRLEPDPAVRAWTDQYSNLLSLWKRDRGK